MRRLMLLAWLVGCGSAAPLDGGGDASPSDASASDASPDDASPDDASTGDASTGDASTGDASAACGAGTPIEEGVVVTTSGAVRGERAGDVWSYRGIPFAEPPQPWRAPEPRACWEGVLDANAWPPACPQVTFDSAPGMEPVGTVAGENDCLAVNVWSPASTSAPRPVLVFIHGGGNQQGASSQLQAGLAFLSGDLLAARADAIVVTLQYRLGPFGFLSHPAIEEDGHAGNYGLLDQQAALRWVQDNIARFGGDPEHVMVFGESGGALDTCALLASPLSSGLFSAALMESGACIAASSADAEAGSIEAATSVGCPAGSDRACLEAVPTSAWLDLLTPPVTGGRVALAWGPSVDGYVLPDVPEAMIGRGEHNHVPFVIGSNADEMAMSVPTMVMPDEARAFFARFGAFSEALLAIYPPGTTNAEARAAMVGAATDAQFTCTARRVAGLAASAQDEPVYRYFFDHAPDNAVGRLFGAIHGIELFYVFGTLARTDYGARMTPDDEAVIALTAERWGHFAGTGVPSGAGLAWPAYDATEPSLVIAGTPRLDTEIRREACEIWDMIAAAAP